MLVTSHEAVRATIARAGSRRVRKNPDAYAFAICWQKAYRPTKPGECSPLAVAHRAQCGAPHDPGTADFLQTRTEEQNV